MKIVMIDGIEHAETEDGEVIALITNAAIYRKLDVFRDFYAKWTRDKRVPALAKIFNGLVMEERDRYYEDAKKTVR